MRAFAWSVTWGRKPLSVFVARRLPRKEFHGGSTEDIAQTVRGSRLFFRLQVGGDKGSLRLHVSATVDRRETDASFIEGVRCFPVSIVLSILIRC
jgi:hypothetical protein